MICSNCRYPHGPNDAVCLKCGHPVNTIDLHMLVENPAPKKKVSFKKIILILVSVLVFLSLVLACFIFAHTYQSHAPQRLGQKFIQAIKKKDMTTIASMIDPTETVLLKQPQLNMFDDSLDAMTTTFYEQGIALANQRQSTSWIQYKEIDHQWYIHLPIFTVQVPQAKNGQTAITIQNNQMKQINNISLVPSIYTYTLDVNTSKNKKHQTGTINAFNAFKGAIHSSYNVQLSFEK